jgi:hypothetical protein
MQDVLDFWLPVMLVAATLTCSKYFQWKEELADGVSAVPFPVGVIPVTVVHGPGRIAVKFGVVAQYETDVFCTPPTELNNCVVCAGICKMLTVPTPFEASTLNAAVGVDGIELTTSPLNASMFATEVLLRCTRWYVVVLFWKVNTEFATDAVKWKYDDAPLKVLFLAFPY